MTYDPDNTPAAQFERYLASVDATLPERPRRKPQPARWWHFAPLVLLSGGLLAAFVWDMGRMIRAW